MHLQMWCRLWGLKYKELMLISIRYPHDAEGFPSSSGSSLCKRVQCQTWHDPTRDGLFMPPKQVTLIYFWWLISVWINLICYLILQKCTEWRLLLEGLGNEPVNKLTGSNSQALSSRLAIPLTLVTHTGGEVWLNTSPGVIIPGWGCMQV